MRRWTDRVYRCLKGLAHHPILTAVAYLVLAMILFVTLIAIGVIRLPAGLFDPGMNVPMSSPASNTPEAGKTATPGSSKTTKQQAALDLKTFHTLLAEPVGPHGETMAGLLTATQSTTNSTYNQAEYAFTDLYKQLLTNENTPSSAGPTLNELDQAFSALQQAMWNAITLESGHLIDQDLRSATTALSVIRAQPRTLPESCQQWAATLVHTTIPASDRHDYEVMMREYRQWQTLRDQCASQISPSQAALLPQDQ